MAGRPGRKTQEDRLYVCAGRPWFFRWALFDIYVMDADGSNQIRLTRGLGQFSAWWPEGRYIVFASAASLAVVRPDGSGLTGLPIGISGDLGFPDRIQ